MAFPRAVEPQIARDEEPGANLLEPEEVPQPEVKILAIMEAPVREEPTEDRPNPHAGVRIGEASHPGPHRIKPKLPDRKALRSAANKNQKEVEGRWEQGLVALVRFFFLMGWFSGSCKIRWDEWKATEE
eukprot:16038759-Heterocapsa_arctica.AAC.1